MAIAIQMAKLFTGFLDIGERDVRDKNWYKVGAVPFITSTISLSFNLESFLIPVLVNRGHELRTLHSLFRSYRKIYDPDQYLFLSMNPMLCETLRGVGLLQSSCSVQF